MALPPVGQCGGSHRASGDRPRLSVERSGVTATAAPTVPVKLIGAPGAGIVARSLSPDAPCGATMARRAEARAPVVTGADLWLAEAAIPCRSRHASRSRSLPHFLKPAWSQDYRPPCFRPASWCLRSCPPPLASSSTQ